MWQVWDPIVSDEDRLAVSVLEPEEVRATVLMFAGFSSKRLNSTNTQVAEKLIGYGVRCVAVDLSGHGDSTGCIEDQTILKASREIRDALAFCQSIPGDGSNRVAVLGNSFSGNAAILTVARDDSVAALALKSPVTDYYQMRLSKLGPDGMDRWRRDRQISISDDIRSKYQFIEDAQSVDTYAELMSISVPVLAVFGSADEEIPLESRQRTQLVMEQSNMTCVIMEGGDHNLSDPHFKPTIDTIANFFLATLEVAS